MRVRLHPDARAEVLEVQKWYYQRSPLIASAFAHEIDSAWYGHLLTERRIKAILERLRCNGGDRLRQESCTSSECMPGSFMQLVKKRGEKTIANNQELALAA